MTETHHDPGPVPDLSRPAPSARVVDLDGIRARAAAATPAPWDWRGNVDHDDPRLVGGWVEGTPGRRDVLGHVRRERTVDDREAKAYAEFLRDARVWDATIGAGQDGKGGKGGYRPYTDEEVETQVREHWLEDQWGEPRTDDRLAFCGREPFYRLAREMVTFEVAPDATERSDPKVYRADIVGVRHPDAEFIAHARQDVQDLLAEVDRLAAVVAGDLS